MPFRKGSKIKLWASPFHRYPHYWSPRVRRQEWFPPWEMGWHTPNFQSTKRCVMCSGTIFWSSRKGRYRPCMIAKRGKICNTLFLQSACICIFFTPLRTRCTKGYVCHTTHISASRRRFRHGAANVFPQQWYPHIWWFLPSLLYQWHPPSFFHP